MCALTASLARVDVREWLLPFGFRDAYMVVSGVANILFAFAMLVLPTQHNAGLGSLFALAAWFLFEMILLVIAVTHMAVGLGRRQFDPGVLVDWILPPICALGFIFLWFRFVVP
jgi:succinate dehydrogenase hydrophobic anchor subunit